MPVTVVFGYLSPTRESQLSAVFSEVIDAVALVM